MSDQQITHEAPIPLAKLQNVVLNVYPAARDFGYASGPGAAIKGLTFRAKGGWRFAVDNGRISDPYARRSDAADAFDGYVETIQTSGDTPKPVTLQERVDEVLRYMSHVTSPNKVTLTHIRWYLDGTYDPQIMAMREDRSTPEEL